MSSLVGRQWERALRQLRVLEEQYKARREVDLAGIVAGVRARLAARLALVELPVAAELADRSGPLGWGRVRTTAWQAPGFRKIVLSHIALPPLIEGFALVLHPSPERALAVFGCDLMALPARVSVNADVYAAPALTAHARGILQPLAESFARLGGGGGPAWAAQIAPGGGLHAKVSLRSVEDASAGLSAALASYLDAATTASQGPGGPETQQAFFLAFHEHGPRRGPLGRLMGAAWADRYSRLVFE
jgi:hypothetical protein